MSEISIKERLPLLEEKVYLSMIDFYYIGANGERLCHYYIPATFKGDSFLTEGKWGYNIRLEDVVLWESVADIKPYEYICKEHLYCEGRCHS